jgi:hypothetical protein
MAVGGLWSNCAGLPPGVPFIGNSTLAGAFEMFESKKNKARSLKSPKTRSLRTTHRPEKKQDKQTGTTELVLTLSVPDGEVVKVETLDKSGQRHELSEEEFAELAGEDEEEISPEEAYAVGIADAAEDELGLDEEEGGDEEEEIERFILREMVARQLLRRGVRRFILHRLRKRASTRQQARPGGKAVHEGARNVSPKNGHEGGKEGGVRN